KIKQNCKYVQKNKVKVLKKLKRKEVLNVVFYVYDETKWKCQYLYELMKNHPKFNSKVVVTKNAAYNLDNPSYQSKEEIKKTFNFFKNNGYETDLGYDFENNKHIPFKKFSPDIIIYQHPWYVETSQGPVVCSKFALTAYVPYDISVTTLPIEYNLRFFQYIENYFVFNEVLKDFYAPLMDNKGINLKSVGAPSLDYFKFNEQKNDKQYVIFAPHWTVNHEKTIAYSTFEQTGIFMLEYAKKHPEFNWVFKPHPMLKKAVVDNNIMTKEEIENYYKEWETLGTACYDCNYFEIFNDSQLMITDCCTFLPEYCATRKPLIRLVSKDGAEFNQNIKDMLQYFYNVESIENLEKTLNIILIDKNDPLKDKRENISLIKKQSASENILNALSEEIYN
ncbi:MAG: hypothetical protein MJ180_00340, partial [Candidatus Gastranaerophilales bacterium]|nr:hypothetical protein [Candidatus Gastranaerophilales bacterium]